MQTILYSRCQEQNWRISFESYWKMMTDLRVILLPFPLPSWCWNPDTFPFLVLSLNLTPINTCSSALCSCLFAVQESCDIFRSWETVREMTFVGTQSRITISDYSDIMGKPLQTFSLLCRPGWTQTHRDLPISASQIKGTDSHYTRITAALGN